MVFAGAVAAVLAVWWIGSIVTSPKLIPPPDAVAVEIFSNPGYYSAAALETGGIASIGLLLSIMLSLGVGLIAVLTPRSRPLIETLAIMTQTMPMVALAPILVFVFGFGSGTKIAISVIISFVPLLAVVTGRISRMPLAAREAAEVLGLGFGPRIRFIELPNVLIGVGAGLRVCSVLAIIGTIIAEFITPQSGLGAMILIGRNNYGVTTVFAGLVLSMALGLVFYGTAAWADRSIVAHLAPSRVDIDEYPENRN